MGDGGHDSVSFGSRGQQLTLLPAHQPSHVSHTSVTRQSYTSVIHVSHTRQSYTSVTHVSHTSNKHQLCKVRHSYTNVFQRSSLVAEPYIRHINPRPTGTPDFLPPTGGGGRGECLNAPRLSRLLLVVEKKRKKTFERSSKMITKLFQSNFSFQVNIVVSRGQKSAKISSFSRLSNKVSENLHYLGNYYSYSKSENGILKIIQFSIAILSSDLT